MPGAYDLEPRSCQVSARCPGTESPRSQRPSGPQTRSSCGSHGMSRRQWSCCGRPRGRSRPCSNCCGRPLSHGTQCWKHCAHRRHPVCRDRRRNRRRLPSQGRRTGRQSRPSREDRPVPHRFAPHQFAPHQFAPHRVLALRRDRYQLDDRPQRGRWDCGGRGTRRLLCCLLASQTDLLEQRRG